MITNPAGKTPFFSACVFTIYHHLITGLATFNGQVVVSLRFTH